MDTEILEDIGLSNAEIKVYLALLELGSSTAGPIIEKSGLQSSVVHMTLNKLIASGFVSSIKEGKRNHYQASNPKHILEYLDEKRDAFRNILPVLLERQRLSQKKPEVITFRGIKGIRELLYELLDAGGKEHLTIGSCEASLMLGESWWVQYHKKRKQKGIGARLIFNQSLKKWTKKHYKNLSEIRFTGQGFEPLTETIIRHETVGIIIWSKNPLGITIQQSEAAKSYKEYFEVLWQQAK